MEKNFDMKDPQVKKIAIAGETDRNAQLLTNDQRHKRQKIDARHARNI